MDERGITPIIATILLVGLSVASISMVAIVVSNLAPGAAAPLAEIGDILVENVRSKSDNMTKITFVHKGGDFVYLNELKVVISGRDNRNVESSTTLPRSAKRTLKLGDVVEVATPATQGYYYPKGSEVRVSIVHESTGTVLADTKTTVSEPADGSEYGFESGTQGWEARTDSPQDSAITAVAPGGRVKLGYGSLQCTVHLIGSPGNYTKGETKVDIQNNPPAGITAPVNLSNTIVTVWVWVPPEAEVPAPRNGIQLFFKDSSWASKYSSWKNIGVEIPANKWTQITVNTATEVWGYDGGCNLSQVVEVGVKIGAGTGSTATFDGYIYVDGFNW